MSSVKNNIYGFLIEKYGKHKITTKNRLFIFDNESVSYYPKPFDKTLKENLLNQQKQIRNDEITFENLSDFDLTKYSNLIRERKKKNEIPLSKINIELDQNKNHAILKDNENIEWELIMNENEFTIFKKIIEEIQNSKITKEKELKNKQIKNIEENQTNKNTNQINQFTNYKFLLNLESLYQILINEYYKELMNNNSKKYSRLIELEFSIQIIVNQFTKYCERICKIIIS